VVSVQARLVLATLCVFNGVILCVVGLGSVLFVDGGIRLVVAAALWSGAGGLFVVARRLRSEVEWR
jgi:hypothetical protein